MSLEDIDRVGMLSREAEVAKRFKEKMEKIKSESSAGSGRSGPPCSVFFDHTRLHEVFEEIELHNSSENRVEYLVKQGVNYVDHLTFLTPKEMRIMVDNFPGQKKYYSSNLPMKTMGDFQRDFERTGLTLTILQNV